jgi:hypothetical protein
MDLDGVRAMITASAALAEFKDIRVIMLACDSVFNDARVIRNISAPRAADQLAPYIERFPEPRWFDSEIQYVDSIIEVLTAEVAADGS